MIEWVDIVCVQETKREQFSDKELMAIGGRKLFKWFCKPASGSKGGMLTGVNLDVMDADLIGEGQFLHGV